MMFRLPNSKVEKESKFTDEKKSKCNCYTQDASLQVRHIIEQIDCPSKVHFLTFKMTSRLLYITL